VPIALASLHDRVAPCLVTRQRYGKGEGDHQRKKAKHRISERRDVVPAWRLRAHAKHVTDLAGSEDGGQAQHENCQKRVSAEIQDHGERRSD